LRPKAMLIETLLGAVVLLLVLIVLARSTDH
jgi:hypothetical protein